MGRERTVSDKNPSSIHVAKMTDSFARRNEFLIPGRNIAEKLIFGTRRNPPPSYLHVLYVCTEI